MLPPYHQALAHPDIRFQTIDVKLSVVLWKALGRGELSRRINIVAERFAEAGRLLSGRQMLSLIYEHFATESQNEQLHQIQDVMDLRCGGEAELEGFWSTWTFVVEGVGSALSVEVLRELLWSKIKHLQCFREELSYYTRVRDVPNHPDYSLGYLSSIIESKIKRDRRQKNRDQISQHIRSRGVALLALDMGDETAADALETSATPAATTDNKQK
eukprot:958738-Amphidinium_carterae.1